VDAQCGQVGLKLSSAKVAVMPLKPFDHSRFKLKRSRQHIGELVEQIRAFLRREPFYLEVAKGVTPDAKRWIVRVREEVPVEFCAIIGDALHNLRAALDLMAVQLVRLNKKSDEDVYFPFSKSARTFDDAFRRSKMNRASPKAITLLKSLKPYSDGNYPLHSLHALDIMDKHQALIPTYDVIAVPDYLARKLLAHGVRISPIKEGISIPVDPEMSPYVAIGRHYRGTFSLLFPIRTAAGETAPLGGEEIVPALIHLANSIDSIIELFAELHR
jgi:hypothetical protein